jgi:hypothetical protein
MSNDDGGFDIVMELTAALLSQAAGAASIPSGSAPISFAGAQGTLTFAPTVDGLTLATGNVFEISVDLEGCSIDFTSVPPPLNTVPPSLQTIGLDGDVVVPVPWSVSPSGLTLNFGNAGAPTVSQNADNSVLAAPLVQFLLAETLLTDPSGALYNQTVQQIESVIAQQIQNQVSGLGPVTLLNLAALSGGIAGVTGKPIAAATGVTTSGNQTIALGLTVGGAGGSFAPPWHSDLLRNSAGVPVDLADFIVSNACFLRDFLEHILSTKLGLSPSGFASVSPFSWTGSAPVPSAAGAAGGLITSAVITSALGDIDGTNIDVTLGLTINGIGGSFTVTATATVTFSLNVVVTGGSLTITLTLLGSPVVNSNVSIAWWVYVAGFVIGGVDAVVLIATANAAGGTVADGIISAVIGAAITLSPITLALPPGTPALAVRAVSLGQSDAPPTTITILGTTFPLPFPQNDILVNLL